MFQALYYCVTLTVIFLPPAFSAPSPPMAQNQVSTTRTVLLSQYEKVARIATSNRGAKIHPIHQSIPPLATLENKSVSRGKKNIKKMNQTPWTSQKLTNSNALSSSNYIYKAAGYSPISQRHDSIHLLFIEYLPEIGISFFLMSNFVPI